MYRHMWAAPKKMDHPDVWLAALAEGGFDAPRFEALVQDPDVKRRRRP